MYPASDWSVLCGTISAGEKNERAPRELQMTLVLNRIR